LSTLNSYIQVLLQATRCGKRPADVNTICRCELAI